MSDPIWGLLGSDAIPSQRRTRTLDIGSSIRFYNNLAVPGLGGIWFGKQLFLAMLGVSVAQEARERHGKSFNNIRTANAIEALACLLTLESTEWKSDPRLRGSTKMKSRHTGDYNFATISRPDFYVTQPMRMSTVQPLFALGLVREDSGSRFNSFKCSDEGNQFVYEFSREYGQCYYTSDLRDCLIKWVVEKSFYPKRSTVQEGLSPLEPLRQGASSYLRLLLERGGRCEDREDVTRRKNALAWMELLRAKSEQVISWDNKPPVISDDHWQDLRTGSLLFAARDMAIETLDIVEDHIFSLQKRRMELKQDVPFAIRESLQHLKETSQAFLDQAPKDEAGATFCREMAQGSTLQRLTNLVRRDELVLKFRGGAILPGPAFKKDDRQTGDEPIQDQPSDRSEEGNKIHWPDNISYRVRNLFLLNADLHGEIGDWLGDMESQTGDFNV
ncbi:hypothetical protein [Pseudodesulfovibrio portus]|uniref:hypothetical protein n=1 Tax=Pseudodesulfovibrio portus TaxID=231439 RepID=UPI00222F6B14|nr:hypothetical protein [Pseudodesulfovibrio portus]